MKTRIPSTLLLVALLGVIGCGHDDKSAQTKPAGDGSAQSPAPTTSAESQTALTGCGWITEAEATTGLGTPMKYRGYDPKSSNCVLVAAGHESDFRLSVDFSVREGSGVYDFISKAGKGEAPSGVGDRAVWAPSALLNTLVVVKGNRELDMALSDLGKKKTPDMRDRALALAKLIVEKM